MCSVDLDFKVSIPWQLSTIVNKQNFDNAGNYAGNFDGHDNVLVQYGAFSDTTNPGHC